MTSWDRSHSTGCLTAAWCAASASQLDVDLLGLREPRDGALERELAAESGLLVAPVGLSGELSATLVHLDPPGLDALSGSDRLVELGCPDIGGQPVHGVVGHRHDVVDV